LNLPDLFIHDLFAQTFNIFLSVLNDFLKFIPELLCSILLSNLDKAYITEDLVQFQANLRILSQNIFLNLEQVLFVGFEVQCIRHALLVSFQIYELFLVLKVL